MAYKLLDGRKLAEKILKGVKRQIKSRRLKLGLAVVLVGDNSVSQVFIRKKREICERVGVGFKLYRLEKNISQQGLKNAVEKIAEEKDNSGIVIQLPLPKNFNSQEVLSIIPPEKDIDCLSQGNLDNFYKGEALILPPVVGAVSHFLKDYNIPIKGKNVVVIGAGRLVGQPVNKWLLSKKARVSLVDKFTKNVSSLTKRADIII
ncbi:MAG: bifunctional 5,10-methylenetetrahydrofolate dehydrogenase/5,10-methenyltetrahydrofolate cyclohydrolase, partial [Candidatus Paceibacterota bacterium]